MDDKTLKKFAKDINAMIPMAETLLHQATVEQRRLVRDLAGSGIIFKFSNLIIALRPQTEPEVPGKPNLQRTPDQADTHPVDEKTLKKFAKDINAMIPVAEALIHQATAEDRRRVQDLAGDGSLFRFSKLVNALCSETARGMFLEGVTSKRVSLPFFERLVRKPKR